MKRKVSINNSRWNEDHWASPNLIQRTVIVGTVADICHRQYNMAIQLDKHHLTIMRVYIIWYMLKYV